MSGDPLKVPSAKGPEDSRQIELRTPSGSHTGFWHELIARVAETAGIDPELATRVATKESGVNPNAHNPVSGAIGIMQLMPATAAALGVDPLNPLENVVGGVRYLREQISHFGDEAKALAAYNWGPGRVTEAVERWGSDWLSHAPGETQHYVASILSPGASDSPSSAPTTEASRAASVRGANHGWKAKSTSGLDSDLAGEVAALREALDAYLVAAILD